MRHGGAAHGALQRAKGHRGGRMGVVDEAVFTRDILHGLQGVPLSVMIGSIGLSLRYCADSAGSARAAPLDIGTRCEHLACEPAQVMNCSRSMLSLPHWGK